MSTIMQKKKMEDHRKCPQTAEVQRVVTHSVRLAVRILGVGMMATVLLVSVLDWPPWVIEEEGKRVRVMTVLFSTGLFIVAVEEFVGINKSAFMLLLAGTMWTFLAVGYHLVDEGRTGKILDADLKKGLAEVGSVILFLLPAMGLVESMDHFGAFSPVTWLIRKAMAGKRERLIPIVCMIAFFLSAIIDNLTTVIVALKILRHLIKDDADLRRLCGGLVVVASNAGGAWSPMGDVTTSMLWIQGQITPVSTVAWLILPAFVAGMCPLCVLCFTSRIRSSPPEFVGATPLQLVADTEVVLEPVSPVEDQRLCGGEEPLLMDTEEEGEITQNKAVVLFCGVLFICMVPTLKLITGLPPYLGMLLALVAMWLLTDMMDFGEEAPQRYHEDGTPVARDEEHAEQQGSVAHTGPPTGGVALALQKVDLSGLLFFAGVLLSVGALNAAGVLRHYAHAMVELCGGSSLLISMLLGLLSGVVDNLPLVQASIDMFPDVPTDDPLWQMVALAAGTGGSILSIGSIAGVTLMSMESVSFLWYMRNIAPWALIGYLAGLGTYQLEVMFLS